MKKIDIAITAGLVVSVFLASFTGFARDCSDVRENLVRLHILANSDSADDQELKLAVRDRVLSESADLFASTPTKEQARLAASDALDDIERAALDEIRRNGYDYPVKARLVNMYFDTRDYEGTLIPAGHYDAVRITIGDALGKNWWCVLFPPMCIPAASEKLPIEAQIEALNSKPRYIPKLAALELLEKLSNGGD